MITPPPPKSKSKRVGLPEAPKEAPANLVANTTDGYADLGFKVTPEFRQRYKMVSVIQNISMKELMEESFKLYCETHGIKI
jgi:hypothetical protein